MGSRIRSGTHKNMRFADPYALRIKPPRETLIFAACQRRGERETQEDYFLNFNDECFVLADGVGTLPHGEVAAKLASETAIWAYKHIRQHRYYWLDKKLFMKRIFRSTNLTIWQKQREVDFREGLKTTLMVVIVGEKTYWLGNAGDSSAWLFHDGVMKKLTKDKDRSVGEPKRGVLGDRRLGLIPEFVSGPFKRNETLVLATDGCANYLTPSDLDTSVERSGSTIEEATNAVTALITSAEANGSEANMTAVIIKRVATRS